MEEELGHQTEFLRTCSKAYDDGAVHYAKMLANTVSVLLYDGQGKTKSLLKQLGLRSSLSVESTALLGSPIGTTKGTWSPTATPLTMSQMSQTGVIFIPHCKYLSDSPPPWSRKLNFADWWDESVANAGKRPLSRKTLIWTVRCQEGGAHVDGEVTREEYLELKDDPLVSEIKYSNAHGEPFIPDFAHWATVRQIAWELDHALKAVNL